MLAKTNPAKIILACWNMETAAQAVESIKTDGCNDVESWHLIRALSPADDKGCKLASPALAAILRMTGMRPSPYVISCPPIVIVASAGK
ncbi:hypothetical protein NQZ79_g8389 [Umbelopsis isabellina]|nr:hypothetical protein NQZ79_g8389 [Umbelopsis isabellina]